MRGEHCLSKWPRPVNWGSSPHARGAHGLALVAARIWGIIPACAGSTGARIADARDGRDHPRMRGEHTSANPWPRAFGGSSPHARGAQAFEGENPLRRGIIPACAGSTAALDERVAARRDHPRMRGEHVTLVAWSLHAPGSSPHARGAPPGHRRVELPQGIIPACAGSTPTSQRLLRGRGDHPRMRGEHELGCSAEDWEAGSSPHARGALSLVIVQVIVPRIIPACAGSTYDCHGRDCRREDHPRMRGEHSMPIA